MYDFFSVGENKIILTYQVDLHSQVALQEVISRDSFCAPEIEIFRAVQQWSDKNPDENVTNIVRRVRLPLMDLDELLNIVRESGMISADAILDAIKTKKSKSEYGT